jgi:hypothetical protein
VKRVVVLGGLGQFGRTAAEALRALGVTPQIAARQGGADVQVDANDGRAIRSAFRRDDLVLDAAGPFHARSTALVEAAIDVGFDVIDINDDLRYADSVLALEPRIRAAGIRVLSSASSVSGVAAAMVRHCGIDEPRRVTAFLAPASRHTARAGTAASLIRSVGRPVRVLRDRVLEERLGWSESRDFRMPPPVGSICGRLIESADVVHLPRVWLSLRDVAMYVDTNTLGVNTLLRVAARSRVVRNVLASRLRMGTRLARVFGSAAGGIGYEIEDGDGRVTRCAIVGGENSFVTAVAPAVLATQSILQGRFSEGGLVPVDRHVEPAALVAFLESRGLSVQTEKK